MQTKQANHPVASANSKMPSKACWSLKRLSYGRESLLISVFSCVPGRLQGFFYLESA